MFIAAAITDKAIADSTRREGSEMNPSIAKLKVMEWASLNAVTILRTFRKASPKSATPIHRPARWDRTAGSNRAQRNRM